MPALPAEKSRQGCERREGSLRSQRDRLSHYHLFAQLDGYSRWPHSTARDRGLARTPERERAKRADRSRSRRASLRSVAALDQVGRRNLPTTAPTGHG